MSLYGHIIPLIAVVLIWFISTGLVAWLDNRPRATFARSLRFAAIGGIAGLVAIVISAQFATVAAAYVALVGALAVWAWHEMSFLMGAVAGPRRGPCPDGVAGWKRFVHATNVLIYHEIALAVTGALIVAASWGMPNQTGAMVFLLLFVMRLSTKLNIFAGVPNMSTEMLPPHLDYMKTYFGPRRFGFWLAMAIVAAAALAVWLGMRAFAAPADSFAAVSASLVFGFAILGTLEHLFLALPFRDGALWGWALPGRNKGLNA
ncbi:putative photosynthetic complex assembly protein PuhE [Parasphingopyxis sp.]|uniref:putative photosynthetic complex assembly protein PuhE n=1 Tax=Parasphingopyxis sp. TaxID=1920299 RepID=UPI002607B625|nr:putative photosynthetic complex assembly protein PuhE [Parasphingopyxis sp.]